MRKTEYYLQHKSKRVDWTFDSFRTESVKGVFDPICSDKISNRNKIAMCYKVFFENRWRRVYTNGIDKFIVFQGDKIEVQMI